MRNLFSLLSFSLLLSALFLMPVMAQTKNSKMLQIVAFGDSLTAGYGLTQDQAFPSILEHALQSKAINVKIINAGVSGDTVQTGLERLDWSIPDDTDGVILELGANDMLSGKDPALIRKDLETIINSLRKRNIPILLVGMQAAPNLGKNYVKEFNEIYPTLAAKYNLLLYPFFLDGVAGQNALNLPDGKHPNGEGVKIIVSRMLPIVETFIANIQQSQ